MLNRYRTNRNSLTGELAAADRHLRAALATICRLQSQLGDNYTDGHYKAGTVDPAAHPMHNTLRASRQLASAALEMVRGARHQSLRSPQALTQINWKAFNQAAANFGKEQ